MSVDRWPKVVILAVSTTGMMSILAISWANGRLMLHEEESSATSLGALAFPVSFLAPFAVLFASCCLRDVSQRHAVWLGCMLSIVGLAVLAIFSAGTLFLVLVLFIGWALLASSKIDPNDKSSL